MHILQRRPVVVTERQVMRALDEVHVIDAWVADVVADRAEEDREALHPGEVRVRAAEQQEPVDAMRDVDGVEPIVVRVRLDVPSLRLLQEACGLRSAGAQAVVVRPEEVRRGGQVPRAVELQRVEVPRVEQVQGQPGALRHGRLRAEGVVEQVPLLVPDGVHRPVAVPALPVVRLQAREHPPVALVHASLGPHVVLLVVADLVERRQLPDDLRQQGGLGPERVRGVPGLFRVRIFLVLLLVVLRGRHGGHGLEDLRGRVPDLAEEVLQRPQDDGGDGVG
mmetsp:Transcript_86921/g.266090  ORF Transcript_86921/g.266090 Transcript_86921/m.266090 type:complete len:279 (-) Transcript_86921:182-1018(-)